MEYMKTKCNACARAIYAALVRGSPPEPCEDVLELFKELSVPKRQQLMMYSVFHDLRQSEREEVVKTAVAVKFDSIYEIIPNRRRWTENLLRALLKLGGCEEKEEVSWDNFLYILLRFCSLTRVELCQALFLMVLQDVESKVQNYITMEQLVDFYGYYAKCPVTSFNTRAVDFTRLPQRRYYCQDFMEMVQRFTVLMNPAVHLQRSLQESLPSMDFWDNHHAGQCLVRKITYDFFKIEKNRCFLWGEPPYRESCEMLAPEALGFIAINKDQWDLRTFDLHERVGALSDGGSMSRDGKLMAPPGYQYRALRQYSVWGEQASPEETERMMMQDHENVYMSAKGYIIAKGDVRDKEEKKPFEEGGADADGKPKEKHKKSKQETAAALAFALEPDPTLDPLADPSTSCLRAACLDESLNPPPVDLPPHWMKMAAIAPAPRVIGPDPPLKPLGVPGMSTQSAFYNSATSWGNKSSGANQTGGFATATSFGKTSMNQTAQSNAKSKSQVKFSNF